METKDLIAVATMGYYYNSDLTTVESRAKVWHWLNAFKPHGVLGC